MAGAISDGTTCLSNLSLTGSLSAVTFLGTFSGTTGSITSLSVTNAIIGSSSDGTIKITSALSLGAGAFITRISQGTFAVAAITVLANRSVATDATISGLSTADVVMVSPTASGYSNGMVLNASVSAADTLTLNFSNVSGATAVQAAGTYKYVSIR